ncbi:single-stranded DNA-binding protein [Microbacterium sp.]|uniref:single-stranded DNA-binding protein n=1 Tax=Microbacterium sp. TaxID=51671 RepID=UPI003A948E03
MSDNITIVGNLAAEPERRRTPGGTPVTTFRVASSQRHYDKEKDSWVDTGTNWYQVSAFRSLADHAAASLHKGDRVIVTGRLKLREWETQKGKGLSVEIDADGVGHDLLWGTTLYTRADGTQSWDVAQAAQSPDGQPTGTDAGAGGWATTTPGGGGDGEAEAAEALDAGAAHRAPELVDSPF